MFSAHGGTPASMVMLQGMSTNATLSQSPASNPKSNRHVLTPTHRLQRVCHIDNRARAS